MSALLEAQSVSMVVGGATLVAIAFVLPSFLMVLALSAFYLAYGGLSWMQGAFYGIGAAEASLGMKLDLAKGVEVRRDAVLRRLVAGRQVLVMAAHDGVEPSGVLDEAVLLVDPDRRQRRGAGAWAEPGLSQPRLRVRAGGRPPGARGRDRRPVGRDAGRLDPRTGPGCPGRCRRLRGPCPRRTVCEAVSAREG